jgi:hypothetical protein
VKLNGVAFDGANIWVANNLNGGTVTKLRASDGVNLVTFAVGSFPFGWPLMEQIYGWPMESVTPSLSFREASSSLLFHALPTISDVLPPQHRRITEARLNRDCTQGKEINVWTHYRGEHAVLRAEGRPE